MDPDLNGMIFAVVGITGLIFFFGFMARERGVKYRRFRIKEIIGGRYEVHVRTWYGFWKSGYVWTDFFEVRYGSYKEAETAIQKYLNSTTLIKGE